MDQWTIAAISAVLAVLCLSAGIAIWIRARRIQHRKTSAERGVGFRSATGSPAIGDVELDRRHELAHLARVSMVGELSGAIAHELNQPLTAILTNAQAAQRMLDADKADPREVYDILTDIISQDKRAVQVIQRLRALLAKDTTDQQVVDVVECSEEVLELAHSTLIARQVHVIARFGRDVPHVFVDRVQVQQVLLNLILNASDAMASSPQENQRQLTVASSMAAEGSVLVTVSDTGQGIAAHEFEKLFEPYYTTKRNGLGLGLSISRTIVAAHGGRIWAVNNPGAGATFCFTLPAVNREPDTPDSLINALGPAACLL
jgi:C4-dicarboxylate-specific signal transduction histidine kinase